MKVYKKCFMVVVFSICFAQATLSAYYDSHLLGTTARGLAQGALFYASEHDGRLPDRLEDIPNYQDIVPEDLFDFVFYVPPPSATMDLPSNTPLVIVTSEDHARMCIGFIGGEAVCFRKAPRVGRPETFFVGLWREYSLIIVSGGLNVILAVALAGTLLFSRRRGRT